MNDNNIYVVQCVPGTFEEMQDLVRMFHRIIESDSIKGLLKAASLDGLTKQRLNDIGARYWQEPVLVEVKARRGRF